MEYPSVKIFGEIHKCLFIINIIFEKYGLGRNTKLGRLIRRGLECSKFFKFGKCLRNEDDSEFFVVKY